ncbi:MAG: hypothetical protein II586_05355, partial [Butyrivibrio sp.]|nr:hypothetical protein [Butyrivibrio sp.]
VQKAVWVMVRVRARKSQYKNAEENMKKTLKIFAFTGVLVTVVFTFIGINFSDLLLGSNRGSFQFLISTFSVLFLCVQGVIRGYLQGVGYTKPIVVSDVLMAVAAFLVGTLFSAIMYGYGLKVNTLFHVDEFSAVYGSTGMTLGLFVASIVGLVHTSVSFYVRRNELEEIGKRSAPRYVDSKNDVMSGLRPILFMYASPGIALLVDQVFYMIHHRTVGSKADPIYNYGIYAGRTIPIVITFSLLCCLPFLIEWNRIRARFERDEPENAGEKLSRFVKHFIEITVPVALFIFTLASSVDTLVYWKGNDFSVELLRAASCLIILVPFAIFFSWILFHAGKSILIVFGLGITWLVHIAMLFVCASVGNIGLYGVLIPVIVSFLVYDILSLIVFKKMLKADYALLVNFAKTLVAAAVAGFVVFLIDMVLVKNIGEILSLVVCTPVFYVIYIAIMVMIGSIDERELRSIPFGKYFKALPVFIKTDEA